MSPMPTPPPIKKDPLRIEICRDSGDLARHAAQLVVAEAGRALGSHGRFDVALSGGTTPRELYAELTGEHLSFQIVWSAVHLFWSDERCVGPDDEKSNYRMAHETLLSKVEIPESNIHRMRGEEDPETAATGYEATIREHLGATPRFDLVLLGMGDDGHTASLFPNDPALDAGDRLVTVARREGDVARLTMTLPLINAARTVMVLVAGEKKADMVLRVLGAEARDEGLPIQSVRPEDGRVVWLLDSGAASLLKMREEENGRS